MNWHTTTALGGLTLLCLVSCTNLPPANQKPDRMQTTQTAPDRSPQLDVTVQTGIHYNTAPTKTGPKKLLLDLYQPVGNPPPGGWPAVVVVHGGAFTFGSRSHADHVNIARGYASNGFVVAVIDYRLVPDDPTPQNPNLLSFYADKSPRYSPDGVHQRLAFISAIEELTSAIGWIKTQTTTPINNSHIFAAGDSAGAMTVTHATYCADQAGLPPLGVAGVISMWGGLTATDPTSPDISPGDPPLFVVHGAADAIVSVEFSRQTVAKARQAGILVDYIELPNLGHSYSNVDIYTPRKPHGTSILDQQVAFMRNVITGQKPTP